MKYILLLLLSTQLQAKYAYVLYTIPDTTINYQLEVTGKAKFKDSVRFEYFTRFFDVARFTEITSGLVSTVTLSMPLSDGVLQISENQVYSTASLPLSRIGSVAFKRIPFGNAAHDLTTNEALYYDDLTGTLFVPNIVIGDGSAEGFRTTGGFAKIKSNYTADDKIETIFVDTSEERVEIDLKPPKKEGKSIFIKRVKGKNRFVVNKEYKVKNDIKLIWDGSTWIRL